MTRTLRLPVARRPGRPRGGDDPQVREALLEAARTLFLRHGFRAVSSRQIAAAARVNPAMIHYYFDGKDGLYRAMLETAIAPVITRLMAMLGQQEGVDIDALARAYMRVLAANPWIPGLIVREVLSPDGSFRQVFIRDFAGRFAPLLRTVIGREIDAGHLRGDLDASLTCVSLLSLALFPFISLPITTRVLGIETNESGVERLINHTLGVFLRGVAKKEPLHA
ncbi:MAG TPA: TetR/AcrR family transcriptional regulator [Steroidobacteraceae bacterium]|jgi:AcrR family transcriptional regulator|nr:TetR/AcrR family transcriptional regulator [Steroidobacteraceae bacterium]